MESGDKLFERFQTAGFGGLSGQEAERLANYLEDRAAAEGEAAHLFLAEAIRDVIALRRDHDQYGGIRNGFLLQLDRLVRERLPTIVQDEGGSGTGLARDFRDEVQKHVQSYDPANTYE